jgi:hypothetical protein
MTATGVLELTPAQYHADREALSASGARKLLTSPAKFAYEREHPPDPTRTFDLGHAAHRVALGAGAELEVIDAANYLTKAAKEAKAAAHAANKIPVLAHEYAQVRQMHAALLAHPLANRLLSRGAAEVSLRWTDVHFGITCRALVDYINPGLCTLVDYKTCESARLDDLTRSVVRYGYDVQDWWYSDGAVTLNLFGGELPAFVFVAQEKTPPYLVRVFDLDDEFIARGRARALAARERFRDCTASGVWPGYPIDIARVAAPHWDRQPIEEY